MTNTINQEKILEWKNEQTYLSSKLENKDNDDISSLIDIESEIEKCDNISKLMHLNIAGCIICGIDVAYKLNSETNEEVAYCSLVFQNYLTYEIEHVINSKSTCKIPYIPGLFSYKETPVIEEALNKATEQLGLSYLNKVKLYVFDGNGYLHQRHMGIASQASFKIPLLKGKATIGIAKSFYKFTDELYHDPEQSIGSYENIELTLNNKREVYGLAYRYKNITGNPKNSLIFISTGNNISLESTLKIVNHYCLNHKDLPTKLADHETHLFRHT